MNPSRLLIDLYPILTIRKHEINHNRRYGDGRRGRTS
jgi:hypothetical protein